MSQQAQGFYCPGCGQRAQLIVGDDQAFCGNDNCHVLNWNMSAVIDETTEIGLVDAPPWLRPPG